MPHRVEAPPRVEAPRPRPHEAPPAPVHPVAPVRGREAARTWQARREWGGGAHPTWAEHRARRWESEHRTWAQRGGYGGYVIPSQDFRARFGDAHRFRIATRPVIVDGYPRFQCGGYRFLIIDPWPEYWEEDWYASDDVWIVYEDGYYLRSRRHPGVSLSISVLI